MLKISSVGKNVKQLALSLILVVRVELYSHLGYSQREFLTKLRRTLLYKPVIAHIYIYPTEIKSHAKTLTCKPS